MLIHCVFMRFDPRFSEAERMRVLHALSELRREVDGMLSFAYGPNRDFEQKTPEHTDGFIVTFRDRAAHLAYERHPRHVELGAQLVAMSIGGADGILVYDIEAK